LHSLAATSGLVVVTLDDVQWFDDASAGLLHFVGRAVEGSHVLIACGARTTELNDNAAMVGLTRAFRREGRLVEMPLDRLHAASLGQLVGAIDADVDVNRVFVESEGNALFAIEIARALARGGSALSETIEELILERLDQVDERTRALVPWAAALGRSFGPEILRLGSGVAPAGPLPALGGLARPRAGRAVRG